MNYSKQYISGISEHIGFNPSNIEKVIRLLDTLDYIFSRSSFKDFLCLKGGTAINLVHTNLKRLSVDIDLDYHHFLEKEKVLKERKLILEELDNYMKSNGYIVSNKSRESVILTSRMYSYVNAFGNNDNIKIEINFIDRISLYPTVSNTIEFFERTARIILPLKEELFGMKIAALIDRSKPRDLYDVDCFFMNIDNIDMNLLRKSTIFYLSLDGVFDINNSLFDGIKRTENYAIKKELLPVLKKGEKFELIKAKNRTIANLSELLILSEEEKQFLSQFSKGKYCPELLFEKEVAERAAKHPMAIWRTLNIK